MTRVSSQKARNKMGTKARAKVVDPILIALDGIRTQRHDYITYQNIADHTNLTYSTVEKLHRGVRQPRLAFLHSYADLLGMKLAVVEKDAT